MVLTQTKGKNLFFSPFAQWGFRMRPFDDDESDEDQFFLPWLEGDSLAPFVGTPGSLLDAALTLAGVTSDDVIVDVGSGDGRIPIWAVGRFGARQGVGIEVDPKLTARAEHNAQSRGVSRVRFVTADVTSDDEAVTRALSDATLLTMFLLPEALVVVAPLLEAHLKRRGRALCLGWPPKGLVPVAQKTLGDHVENIDAFLFDASSLTSSL